MILFLRFGLLLSITVSDGLEALIKELNAEAVLMRLYPSRLFLIFLMDVAASDFSCWDLL